jgi:hypothetical protein
MQRRTAAHPPKRADATSRYPKTRCSPSGKPLRFSAKPMKAAMVLNDRTAWPQYRVAVPSRKRDVDARWRVNANKFVMARAAEPRADRVPQAAARPRSGTDRCPTVSVRGRSPGRSGRSRPRRSRVLSALAPAGGYQSSWGTLLLVLGGMKRDAVPGMSINGRQASV